jgi:3-(3-hydroxy-phenyl)propionate hydroxylase
MRDLHFDQRWLVVDVATDLDLGLWDGVHQVCDARRPATYLRVGPRRHRWEFRLADDEGPEDFPDLVAIAPLLQPWLGSVPVGELQLVRSAVYTFRARLADRWRDRRVFLLGDAAHLTPPFIGQGIGAGLRDAANLAWKLAGALDGTLPDDVLDSYEAERKPHARSMIRLARLVGVVMTAGGGVGDATRRLVAPRLPSVPGLRRRALDSATPALGRSSMVRPSGLPPRLAGSLCPNVVLPGGDRFDEVVGRAFAVVTTRTPTPEQQREIEGRGVVLLRCDETSELGTWLRQGRARVAVVRPDRSVLRTARDLAVSIEGLPASRPARSSPLPR